MIRGLLFVHCSLNQVSTGWWNMADPPWLDSPDYHCNQKPPRMACLTLSALIQECPHPLSLWPQWPLHSKVISYCQHRLLNTICWLVIMTIVKADWTILNMYRHSSRYIVSFNPLQRGNYQPHQLETKPLKVKRVMTWLTFLDLLGSLQLLFCGL